MPKHCERSSRLSRSSCSPTARAVPLHLPDGTRNELTGASPCTATGTLPRKATTAPVERRASFCGILPAHAGSEETMNSVPPAACVTLRLILGCSSPWPRHSTTSPGCGRCSSGQNSIHSPRSARWSNPEGPEAKHWSANALSLRSRISSFSCSSSSQIDTPLMRSSSTSTVPKASFRFDEAPASDCTEAWTSLSLRKYFQDASGPSRQAQSR
mmetsp:Transcript_21602/g.51242  ORF Transcript_21602/g.51242 Transcript_21602/m.51242 type:complete len:213 (+) Transcript_21602:301-939(+)